MLRVACYKLSRMTYGANKYLSNKVYAFYKQNFYTIVNTIVNIQRDSCDKRPLFRINWEFVLEACHVMGHNHY